jgi:polynucleotide 5'-triphosphatase
MRDGLSSFLTVQHPLGSPSHSRRKDRISYAHEEFVVDLTQVTSFSAPGSQVGLRSVVKTHISSTILQPELLHELELEFTDSQLLAAAAVKRGDENCPEPERSAFDELIRAFVNNARILVRNAEGSWR